MSGMKRFGSYYLLKKIATGGMAELYKAKKPGEKGFEKLLAIKLILPHLAASDEFISMFIDEAKVAALLNHQNIVQIYDLGRIEESYCIVMEYVRGRDLRSVIARAIKMRAPVKMEHACLITANTLAGLGYAHRKKDKGKDLGIVHRDISPQNILISYEGEVKIVDFGIAKAATQSRDTQAGVLKGKMSYMSPEQAMGRPLDMRSDVFSTGVVLYELLTGRKLFQGDTDIATIDLVRAARVEPLPSKLSKSFPAELEAILLKALAREPENRYQGAAEMEAALLEFMRSRSYSTSVYSLSEYMHRLFADEIEAETRDELELDQTVVTEAVEEDTQAEKADTPQPARMPSAPLPAQPKPPARAPVRAAPPRPAVAGRDASKGGWGGILVAVIAVVAFAVTGVWFGAKAMRARRAAEPPLPPPSVTGPGPVELPPAEEPGEAGQVQPAPSEAVVPPPAEPPAEEPAPVKAAEPPRQPEPPAPAVAVVNSEPGGAEVFVDGRSVGRTPLELPGLKPDAAHPVVLKLAGYNDWTGSFKAAPGATGTINAVLKELVFGIEASSTPPGARVLIDGRDTGRQTPARMDGLKPGRNYTVRLELAGYAPHEERVGSEGPGTVRVSAALARLYGQLTVNTRPWAFVFVDGEKMGMTPLAGIKLPAGEHQLLLDNPKLNLSKRMKVNIKPDETTRIVTDLGKRD